MRNLLPFAIVLLALNAVAAENDSLVFELVTEDGDSVSNAIVGQLVEFQESGQPRVLPFGWKADMHPPHSTTNRAELEREYDKAIQIAVEKSAPKSTSGEDGRVLLPRGVIEESRKCVFAYEPDRDLVGILQVADYETSPIRIRMFPACHVTVNVASHELADRGQFVEKVHTMIFRDRMRKELEFGHSLTHHGSPKIVLPPGDYAFILRGPSAERKRINVSVQLGERQQTVDVDLSASRLTRIVGQESPDFQKVAWWKNTEPVRMEDLRGKVLLVYFWFYPCGPCMASMPRLLELHQKYAEQGLSIVALHADTRRDLTVEQMKANLKLTENRVAGGQEFPFIVALDGGGKTLIPNTDIKTVGATAAAFGVYSFPTAIAIDRGGVVVGKLNLRDAAEVTERIEGLLLRE